MISEETIQRIWSCNREIVVGKKLLEEMIEIAENLRRDGSAERIKDAFGRERDLQLGIPCGTSSTRLLNVSPALAVSIINVHIANKQAELVEANEQARIELGD
jgi:hypothetical protein